MIESMQISAEGLALLQHYERCRLTSYQIADGSWEAGWACAPVKSLEGARLSPGEVSLAFARKIDSVAAGVSELLKRDPNQREFDAMLCVVMDVGLDAFGKSEFLHHWNDGEAYTDLPGNNAERVKAEAFMLRGCNAMASIEAAMA